MLEAIKDKLPDFAKDVRINFMKVLDVSQNDGLSEDQILGSALAVAYHLGNEFLVAELRSIPVGESVNSAAKLAASLMAMTNIYYRFVHLSEQTELSHVPAGLRMQGMMNPGVDKATFETMSMAVSIVNGCGACISAHAQQLKQQGITANALARIGRIAAVLHAVHICLNMPD